MSQWVDGCLIVSDFGDSYCIYRACELVSSSNYWTIQWVHTLCVFSLLLLSKLVSYVFLKNWLIFRVWTKYWPDPQYGQNRLANRWTLPQTWRTNTKQQRRFCEMFSSWYNWFEWHAVLFSISFKTLSKWWGLTQGSWQDSKLDILHSIRPQNSRQDSNVGIFVWLTFVVFNSYI